MQRHPYNTVTIPLLIEAPRQWAEGEAYVEDDRVRVREFTDDDVDQKQECGKQNWKEVPEKERLEILRAANVIRALESNDQLAAKKALLDLTELTAGPSSVALGVAKRMIDDPDYIQDSLVYKVYHQLKDVRFVLWKKTRDRKLAAGLFCASIRSAFWVRTLMSAMGAMAGFRICTKCGNTFWQKRSDQEYCSLKCREAHRIERWRAKKAKAPTAEGNGSTSRRRKAR